MKIAVFDTEDDSEECLARDGHGFNKKVVAIACITEDGLKYHEQNPDGCNVAAFLEWTQGLAKQYLFYAFNLSYDLGIWRKELPEISVEMIGGKIIEARVGKTRFRDAANLYTQTSVAKLGQAFGLKKLERDILSKDYVFRDCEIVLTALLFLRDELAKVGVERLPKTIGGCAVRAFEATENPIPHCSDGFVKQAYYGGRVEIFRPSARNCFYEDVNSMYPWAMLGGFPEACEKLARIEEAKGIARVKVRVKEGFIAPLPVRVKVGSGLATVYPHGVFDGWYSTEELQNENVEILKVYEVWGSKREESYYEGFIQHYYRARLEAKNEPLKLLYKLLMNNLYGRLAMEGELVRSADITEKDFDKQGNFVANVPYYGGKKLIKTQTDLPETVNYLHAVIVTARARIKLRERLEQLGQQAVYCDTDSVIHTGTVDGDTKQLGGWKLEATPAVVQCWQPKVYRIDQKFKAKGVRAGSAKSYCEEGFAVDARPYKFKESVRLWTCEGKSSLAVWRNVRKERVSEYSEKKDFRNGCYWPKNISDFNS